VIVTVDVPVAAVALAVNVSVVVLVPGFGLNAVVTPAGNPETENVTSASKPFNGVIVTVLVPELACRIVRLLGLAASVNDGASVTVSWIVVVSVRLPDTPVIVTVNVPVVAVLLALRDKTLVVVAGFVPNEAVTPVGNPEAESVTSPENPLTGLMVIVLAPATPPFAIVTVVGAAVSVKLFTREFTVRLIVVVSLSVPDVPVIVTVTVPVAAVVAAVRVSVLVVVPGFGLNAAVTPLGNPEAVNVTSPLNPPDGSIVTVLVPVFPCTIVTLAGAAEMAKPGATPGQLLTRL
jgi:hypothetical protein